MADLDTDGAMSIDTTDDRSEMQDAAEQKALDDRKAADDKAQDRKKAADRRADDQKQSDEKRMDDKRADDRRAEQRQADQRRNEQRQSRAEPQGRAYEANDKRDAYREPHQQPERQSFDANKDAQRNRDREQMEIDGAQSGAPSDRPAPPASNGPLKPLDIAQDHRLPGERAAVERREYEDTIARQQEGSRQVHQVAPATPQPQAIREVDQVPAIEASEKDRASAEVTHQAQAQVEAQPQQEQAEVIVR